MNRFYRTRGSRGAIDFHCAGPIGHEGPEVNEHSDDARIGTIAHAMLACYVTDVEIDVDAMADASPDPEATRVAYFTGRKIWDEVKPTFPGALVEVPLRGEVTKGTADIVSIAYDRATVTSMAIGDWKLADSGEGHPEQLRCYAAAAVDKFGAPTDGFVTLGEFWLLDGEYQIDRVSLDELDDFKAHMRSQHENAGKQFAAGHWCRYCPIRLSCTIRDEYMRSASAAFTTIPAVGEVSRETLAALWDKSRLVKKALDEYDKAISLALDDGPLDIGGGRRLERYELETVTFPRVTEALDFLRGTVDCDKVCRISKTALAREVKARAPKGQGAGRMRVLLGQLEANGMTGIKRTKRRRVVKS